MMMNVVLNYCKYVIAAIKTEINAFRPRACAVCVCADVPQQE